MLKVSTFRLQILNRALPFSLQFLFPDAYSELSCTTTGSGFLRQEIQQLLGV